MLRLLSLNLQHALPGAGAADPAGSGSGADADRANTADVANADITDPEAARTVLAVLADQIAELAPDVVALQEVDKGQARSGYLDQAAVLAELLGWEHYRFAAPCAGPVAGLRRRPRRSALANSSDDVLGLGRALLGRPPAGFGNALLSRHPVTAWRVQRLGRGPATLTRRVTDRPAWDPRGYELATSTMRNLLTATLTLTDAALTGVSTLSVGTTHLATRTDTATGQLAAAWGALATLPGPHLLAGDYNLRTEEVAPLGIGRQVGDGPTFPAWGPDRRIDHVLTDPWPTGVNGAPAFPVVGAPAWNGARHPLLQAASWGTRTFVVSDHAGTWVDLEPVG